jgi:hypothetical protein
MGSETTGDEIMPEPDGPQFQKSKPDGPQFPNEPQRPDEWNTPQWPIREISQEDVTAKSIFSDVLNHPDDQHFNSLGERLNINDRVQHSEQTGITGTVVRFHGPNNSVVLDDSRDEYRFDDDPEGEEGTLVYPSSKLAPYVDPPDQPAPVAFPHWPDSWEEGW